MFCIIRYAEASAKRVGSLCAALDPRVPCALWLVPYPREHERLLTPTRCMLHAVVRGGGGGVGNMAPTLGTKVLRREKYFGYNTITIE